MPVLGMRHTDNLATNERPTAFRLGIHNLYPQANPLINLILRTGKSKVADPEFTLFEKAYPTRELVVNGDHLTTGALAPLLVDSGGYNCRIGTILINTRTLERMRVTSNPTADTGITIAAAGRSIGATAAANILDNDVIQVIGTSHEEGASLPKAVNYDPTTRTNYLQIFRNPTDLTETVRAVSNLRTGSISKEAKREALLVHETDKEWAFLYGEPSEITTGTGPERTTGGFLHFVTTNVTDFTSTGVSKDGWSTFLSDVFTDGSDEKLFLCGKEALLTLNNMAEAWNWPLSPMDRRDTFGMDISRWLTPFGTLMIKQHRLLSKSATFKSWGFLVDPDNVGYRYLQGRDTDYLTNRQAPGDDKRVDEWLAEVGFEIMHEETHGVAKGMTTYVP